VAVEVIENRGIEHLDESALVPLDDPLDRRRGDSLDGWREVVIGESAIDLDDTIPRVRPDVQAITLDEVARVG
jgi:hypothetical protein